MRQPTQAKSPRAHHVDDNAGAHVAGTREGMIDLRPSAIAQRKLGSMIEQGPRMTVQRRQMTVLSNGAGGVAQLMAGRWLTDDSDAANAGKINKNAFLAQLRREVEIVAKNVLEPAGLARESCPDLEYWMDYYQNQDAAHVEQAILHYAPAASGAQDWQDMLRKLVQRVEQGLIDHIKTGENKVDPEPAPSAVEAVRPDFNPATVQRRQLPIQNQAQPIQLHVGKKKGAGGDKNRKIEVSEKKPALEEPGVEPKIFGLGDFDPVENTTTRKTTLSNVLPAEVGGRHLENEELVNVDSDLTHGGMFATDDERVMFNNYFSAKTWVMADVFKGRNLTNFTMNQAIEKQAEIAKVPLTGLQQVVIKNIVNKETKDFVEKHRFEHGAEMNQEQLIEFLTRTPLGKGTCWTVCSEQNSRVPTGATVLKNDGLVIIIRLAPLTRDNADFMARITPYR